METKVLCFKHAKETIQLLFHQQRMVIDTNIPRNTPTQCEHSETLVKDSRCTRMATLKVTVLAKYEPYVEPQYLEDMQKRSTVPSTTQSTFPE